MLNLDYAYDVWLCELGKNEPAYLIEDKVHKMIEFPGSVVYPRSVTPDNIDGIYIIRATGSYEYDKDLLARLLGLNYYEKFSWKSHHIEYNIDTNEMRMQLVDPLYHSFSHYGGAGQFGRVTGFTYGTQEAIEYCRWRNIDYMMQLIQNSKIWLP